MPIVAVASIAMGASALAAGATGFAALSAIGGIVAGIGGLTKSKELMMLGGIAGLAGGIASFAQSQNWLSGAEAVSNTGAMIDTPAPGIENVNPTDMRLAAGTQATPMESSMQAGAETAGLDGNIQQAITQQSPAAQAISPPPADSLMNGAGPLADVNPTDLRLADGTQKPPMMGGKDGGSIFDTINAFGQWMEKNKTLSTIGASFVGGMFDPKGQYYEDMAELEKQRARNANDIPNLGLKLKKTGPAFPTTRPTYTPPRIGLMNAG